MPEDIPGNRIQTVAIVGLGLIGGSFGLALRSAGFTGRILGVSEPQFVCSAIERGVIHVGASLAEAAEAADLIYLAEPVDRILLAIEQLSGRLQPHTLVTDVGSTKRTIVQHAAQHLPPGQFLGGHPMAGKERRGIEAAEATLFRDRPYILTHSDQKSDTIVSQEFCGWLEKIGSQLLQISADDHDRAVAFTSHLPQLLSTALACTLSRQNNPLLTTIFGPGLVDMTRLSRSSVDLWSSVLATNADEVAAAIEYFQATLTALRTTSNSDTLPSTFAEANSFTQLLRQHFTNI